ncbi:MAG: hypothetical protein PHN31_02295 [Candidatus Gracilibacteria bacterium]|nr:hypothetical protein [Candidatus Gracilibacteria bacterium]
MNQEKIIETKTCKHCQTKFDITDKDLAFYEKVSPMFSNCHPELVSGSLKGQNNLNDSGSRPEGQVLSGIKEESNGKIKYLIPTPKLCPDCRMQRRLTFRNEFNYYKTNCDLCNKNIISVHLKQNSKFPIYCQHCWRSDHRNQLGYGVDFDFSRAFFKQYLDLQNKVPKINMINDNGVNSENSEYCYNFSYGKNNYLITTAWHAEESMYCQYGGYFKYNIDCNLIFKSEIAYECSGGSDIYNCFFLNDSNNCNNCFLGIDLKGCSNCFGCIGLRNKKYYIFNKKYEKEEYEKITKNYLNGSYKQLQEIKKEFYDFSLKYPRIATHQNNCTNSIGDRLNNCKNVLGNNIYNGENCKYYWGGADSPRMSYDIFIGGNHDLGYDSIVPDNTYQACFTNYCDNSKFVFYSDNCFSCSNIFGCIGLRDKSYCILNKQYTKQEYEILVPKIIEHMQKTGEWGEFFPSSLSPFGYNETLANEYFPLSRYNVLDCHPEHQSRHPDSQSRHPEHQTRHPELVSGSIMQGNTTKHNIKDTKTSSAGQLKNGPIFNWSDYEAQFPKVEKIIPSNKLPDSISQIPDDILNRAIECEITKKPFKIIKQELDFYRKHNLPIPRRHPNQRYLDRMNLRNPRKLYDRKCDKCGKNIKTTYAPDRSEIIYCEECYEKQVY